MYKIKLFHFVLAVLTASFINASYAEGTATKTPSYADALKGFMEEQAKQGKSPFTPEEMALMQGAQERLAKQMPHPGLAVGSKAPDFTLVNADGKKVTLSQELKKGPVVLVFYRGAWCPFCNMHLHALQQSIPEFNKYKAQLIAVTPQKPDKSAEQIKKDKFAFKVVSDLDSSVMQKYQLYFEVEPELAAMYKKHGLDLTAFNGEGRNVLPVPGSFVIDSKGIIRAVHADIDYKQRMEPQEIIEALKKLK